MENPYQSPEASSQIEEAFVPGAREYEGIRRLPFVGILLGIGVLQFVVAVGIALLTFDSAAFKAMTAAFTILLLFPVHARLKNIGSNPVWCFLMLVPMLNLLLLLRCVICPEGYADSRKLDIEGKVMVGIAVALFLLMTFAIAAALFGSAQPNVPVR